jgi:hypothetical protein
MSDNISSINSPLKFFSEFFSNGFNEKLKGFYSISKERLATIGFEMDGEYESYIVENPSHMIECNEDEGYIIAEDFNYDTKKWEQQYKRIFSNELQKLLDTELKNAVKNTKEAILQKVTFEAQGVFIDSLLRDMEYIIVNELPNIDNPKYINQCQTVLVSYIKEIAKRYPKYIPKDISTKYITSKKAADIYSLNMIPRKYNCLQILLDELKKEGFVEQSLTLELFQKAFDNSKIENPLNIKWIKIDAKKCYYTSALELVQQLQKKNYIKGYTYKQLSNIFVQVDGSLIDGWRGRNYDKEHTKKGRNALLEEIEVIVRSF